MILYYITLLPLQRAALVS